MANEIEATFRLNYASTVGVGLKDLIQPDTVQYTQSTPGVFSITQSVGTGTTTLNIADDAGTPGVLFIQNLDSENSISFGSSLLEFKVSAGKFAFMEVSSSAAVIQVAASTGTVRVFQKLFEA